MSSIYLDYNATTPIDHEVAEVMRPYLDKYFGNPSSNHRQGIENRLAVENARKKVADLIGCQPDEIVFTSGGTESNNYAIKGVAYANKNKGKHIITSSIEHPAVIEVCRYLEKNGFIITYAPVDEFGIVDIEFIKKSIRPDTILISIMQANNEVGTIQPISEISKLAKENGIIMHTDAAQSVGKIQVDVKESGVDLLSIAGHKLYAPKGIGVLYVRKGIVLEKLIHGADHECNRRAGTENVLEIVGLGKACEIAKRNLGSSENQMSLLRDQLENLILHSLPESRINGKKNQRLPNTSSISFNGFEANTILAEMPDIAASAGAACHSESSEISGVLSAMNVPETFAMGTIRFSVGKYTTKSEIEKAAEIIIKTVKGLNPVSIPSNKGLSEKDMKLTQFTQGLGCACKMRPQYLEEILKTLSPIPDSNVLVGINTSDDAVVYKISDDMALVQTVDFFTPVVDDPYSFGAIAAANALSDIYAMGAKPLFALNIVGFPDKRLSKGVLKQILKGAEDKAAEAGICIAGGHTIEDNEPKFGMVVTGSVNPHKFITNSKAKPGDILVLTKPIGLGIMTTALKRGLLRKDVIEKITSIMTELNKKAAEVMAYFPVNACTDVSGFGLLGHLLEMTKASGMNAELFVNQIPIIDGCYELAIAGIISGGTKNNLDFVNPMIDDTSSVSQIMKYILADAQTSGGLLISLPEKYASSLVDALHEIDVTYASIIGEISGVGDGKIKITNEL